MKKRSQIAIFFIIAVVLAAALGLFLLLPDSSKPGTVVECALDVDCVPASCCHPSSCVASGDAPQCQDSLCSQECQAGTLDCGQGSCGCVNKKCVVQFE